MPLGIQLGRLVRHLIAADEIVRSVGRVQRNVQVGSNPCTAALDVGRRGGRRLDQGDHDIRRHPNSASRRAPQSEAPAVEGQIFEENTMNPIHVCALGNAIHPLHGILSLALDLEFFMAHTTIRGSCKRPPHNHGARMRKSWSVALRHGDLNWDGHLRLVDGDAASPTAENFFELPRPHDGVSCRYGEYVVQVATQIANLDAHRVQFVYVGSRRYSLPAHDSRGLPWAELLPSFQDLLHKDGVLHLLKATVGNQRGPREDDIRPARLHNHSVRVRKQWPGRRDLDPARLRRLGPPRPPQPVRQAHGDLVGVPDDQMFAVRQRHWALKVPGCGLTAHGRSLRPCSPRDSFRFGSVAESDLQIGHILVGETVRQPRNQGILRGGSQVAISPLVCRGRSLRSLQLELAIALQWSQRSSCLEPKPGVERSQLHAHTLRGCNRCAVRGRLRRPPAVLRAGGKILRPQAELDALGALQLGVIPVQIG
mmetsp:Transcript_51761/g.136860  ORF Transcript_51761/g.136860 Transcript_51761/m.136860 type:complete len:481 (-) Transcript_51761:4295-5737(-)